MLILLWNTLKGSVIDMKKAASVVSSILCHFFLFFVFLSFVYLQRKGVVDYNDPTSCPFGLAAAFAYFILSKVSRKRWYSLLTGTCAFLCLLGGVLCLFM